MNGVERIAAERQRQKDVEGWNAEDDARYTDSSLAVAAACYAVSWADDIHVHRITHNDECVDAFPFRPIWDKRHKHGNIRSLEIAGALIAAELDRLLRVADELAKGIEQVL